MSTTSPSMHDLGPLLVSDLPPVTAPITTPLTQAYDRLRMAVLTRWTARRDRLAFERAVRWAGPSEHTDLLAAERHAS